MRASNRTCIHFKLCKQRPNNQNYVKHGIFTKLEWWKNEGYFHLDSLTMQQRQHSARSILLTLADTRREYFNLYAISVSDRWRQSSPCLYMYTHSSAGDFVLNFQRASVY